jgi:hypothetical protein
MQHWLPYVQVVADTLLTMFALAEWVPIKQISSLLQCNALLKKVDIASTNPENEEEWSTIFQPLLSQDWPNLQHLKLHNLAVLYEPQRLAVTGSSRAHAISVGLQDFLVRHPALQSLHLMLSPNIMEAISFDALPATAFPALTSLALPPTVMVSALRQFSGRPQLIQLRVTKEFIYPSSASDDQILFYEVVELVGEQVGLERLDMFARIDEEFIDHMKPLAQKLIRLSHLLLLYAGSCGRGCANFINDAVSYPQLCS